MSSSSNDELSNHVFLACTIPQFLNVNVIVKQKPRCAYIRLVNPEGKTMESRHLIFCAETIMCCA